MPTARVSAWPSTTRPVFCRGVCWTPLDIARLGSDAADYRAALEQLRDAGMNMVRVGGTMVYETDDFHDLCDELGILVWQDFMFANMDYRRRTTAIRSLATCRSRRGNVSRRSRGARHSPCAAATAKWSSRPRCWECPAGSGTHPLFTDVLPALVASLAPGVAWVPSTPTGGALPVSARRGVSHYYGVGAYRGPSTMCAGRTCGSPPSASRSPTFRTSPV